MTQLQEEFLTVLKSKKKFTAAEYATVYAQHRELSIKNEEKNGAGESQAVTMGEYYAVTVLTKFISNDNIMSRVLALYELNLKKAR
ncbi:MAG: hypothetical protein Q9M32_02865 [Sulfurimonas sp.]|nr:hypothetical protein [Sulfurimonas sp.]MDQ7059708.1 hypothetical protein [Sulfurimonas sp.]